MSLRRLNAWMDTQRWKASIKCFYRGSTTSHLSIKVLPTEARALEPFSQITTLTLAFLHTFIYSSTASSNTYFPHLSLE